LFDRIFFDQPVSNGSENALAVGERLIFSSINENRRRSKRIDMPIMFDACCGGLNPSCALPKNEANRPPEARITQITVSAYVPHTIPMVLILALHLLFPPAPACAANSSGLAAAFPFTLPGNE